MCGDICVSGTSMRCSLKIVKTGRSSTSRIVVAWAISLTLCSVAVSGSD
jgi:hypothetical protein